MKFTLNEKYILNEAKFILNEETADETIINNIKIILDKLTNIKNKITVSDVDYLKNKQNYDELSEIADQVALAEDKADVKSKAVSYINKLKEIIGKRLPLLPNIYIEFNTLLKNVQPIDKIANNTEIAAIKNEISKINDLLITDNILKTDDTKIKEVITAVDNTINLLNKINSNVKIFTDTTKHALATKNDLVKLNTAIGKVSQFKLKDTNLLVSACNEFNESETAKYVLTKEKNDKIENEKEEADKKAANEKEDADKKATSNADTIKKATAWEEKYKQTNGSQEFWDGYFLNEFSDKITNNLIRARLEEEIEVLGFSPIKNTFITYLHSMIDNYPKIFDILNTSEYAYNEIHNAVANNNISNNELANGGILSTNNIIYCENFYKKTASEMTDYIETQHNILQKADYNTALTNKIKTANYSDGEGRLTTTTVNQFVIDLFYKPGSLLTGAEGNIKSGLNSLAKIDSELTLAFGEANKKPEIKTDEDIKNVMSNWGIANLTAGDRQKIESIIIYLLNKLSSENKKSMKNKYPKLDNLSYNDKIIDSLDLPVKFDSVKINAAAVKTIINELCKVIGIINNNEGN